MRKFSEKEKKIIAYIVNAADKTQAFLLINAYQDIFCTSRGIGYDTNTSEIVYNFSGNTFPDHESLLDIYNDVVNRTFLLDYLIDEHLIYIQPMGSQTGQSLSYIGAARTKKNVAVTVTANINQSIKRLINNPTYITETLRLYVADGFLSLEEQTLAEAQKQSRESSRQTKWSMLSVIIALIALALSLYSGLGNRQCHTNKPVLVDTGSPSSNSSRNVMSMTNTLSAVQKNVAEIHAKLCDTLNVRVQTNTKHSVKGKTQNQTQTNIKTSQVSALPHKDTPATANHCLKTVTIDVCQDTVVSKKEFCK